MKIEEFAYWTSYDDWTVAKESNDDWAGSFIHYPCYNKALDRKDKSINNINKYKNIKCHWCKTEAPNLVKLIFIDRMKY